MMLLLIIVALGTTIYHIARPSLKARFVTNVTWLLTSFAFTTYHITLGNTGFTVLWAIFFVLYGYQTHRTFKLLSVNTANEDSNSS